MYVDEYGNCTFVQWNTQTALSDLVTHYKHSYNVDKPGKVRVLDAINADTGKELYYIQSSEKGLYHKFIVIFQEPLKKGDRFKYKYSLFVENYLSNLIEKDIGNRTITSMHNAKFKNRNITIYFPNIKQHKNLVVTLTRRTDKEGTINQKIEFVIEKTFKTYKIITGDISGDNL